MTSEEKSSFYLAIQLNFEVSRSITYTYVRDILAL